MKVLLITSDEYDHLLRGMAHLFNKYWSAEQEVTILCYRIPPFELPANFVPVSVGSQKDFEGSWTDGLIPFFDFLKEDYFTILLEDYWLVSPVDFSRLEVLESRVRDGSVDRADLGGGISHHYPYDEDSGLHILPQDADYRNSLQPSIWTKKYFRKFLKPRRSPWDFEVMGMEEARNDGAVVASLPLPILFDCANIMLKGKRYLPQVERIEQQDMKELQERGFIE